jgi:hypothetical protein
MSERDAGGRLVREVWIEWAREQPNPKPSWLVPWEGLSESDREVDRRIAERLMQFGRETRNDPVAGIFPGATGDRSQWGDCGCWTCVSERVKASAHPFSMPFIVCPDCGNKRCPKATHHDRACTASNDTDQPGSRFATSPAPTANGAS